MTVFLTSSPTGPLDHSRYVDGLDEKNRFIETLRERWPEWARCLYITADPGEFTRNDEISRDMAGLFSRHGMTVGCFDVLDDRWKAICAEDLFSYQVLILGGGHVPTQNEFFQRIRLREKLQGYPGIVIGISAGTMNSADVVYAQPELPGESVDPKYARFLQGLGLTQVNILPHYQMVREFELDGRRLFEDITYGDSWGQRFLALPDGSYLLLEDGHTLVCGEAYLIADGELRKICEEDNVLSIE